jgi:hypothetical protein
VGFLFGVFTFMMSGMEKSAQIGDLVQQRQGARTALEHLKLKGKKIAAAYSAFGSGQDRWQAHDPSERGGVFLLHPKVEEMYHPQNLLGQAELADHIRETAAAEAARVSIKAQLSNLGITD